MVEPFKVDKYATISYRGNRYSVSDRLVGKFVEAKIFSNHLEIYYQEKHIATHNRSYGLHQWVIQLGHYLDTFKKKPGALPGSEALAQSPKFLKQMYAVHYQDSPKDFIELVLYCQKHKIAPERLQQAYHHLLQLCPTGIDTEKLTALLGNRPGDDNMTSLDMEDQIITASKQYLQALSDLV